MHADGTHAEQIESGSVAALWRYPVKSMLGEELNAAEVTTRGLLGDRRFAVVDAESGKVAGAKNPRKWGNFFDFRAAYAESPRTGSRLPAVQVTFPDGTIATSDEGDLPQALTRALGREVSLAAAQDGDGTSTATAEEYWPDLEGLDFRDTVTDFELPPGTFFDLAPVHLLTTATIDRLRVLYPEGRFEARRFRPNIVISTGAGQPRLRRERLSRPDDRDRRRGSPAGDRSVPPLCDDHARAGGPAEGSRDPSGR